MGDPLSIASGIIAILQLAAKATGYIKDARGGSSDRTRLRDELRSTVCLLEMLKDRLDDDEDAELDAASVPLGPLSHPEGPLFQFRRLLEDIIAKLVPQGTLRRLAQPLTWPFDKKDIAEMLSTLERLKSHFLLVMQNDLVQLAKISILKLENFDKRIETAESKALEEEMQKIIRWISPLSFRARHATILESVQPGTGTWFLEHDKFLLWAREATPLLWCSGIPGAGKTALMSMAINHVNKMDTVPDVACSYIYCDHNQRHEQTQTALLSSLLQQIIQQRTTGTLPPEISSLYNLHQKYGTRPTLSQITENLRKLLSELRVVYVIIDALDECAENEEEALAFISTVCSLGPKVKVLCTSRPSATFKIYFEGSATLNISARDDDIRKFLEAQIQQHHKLQRHTKGDPTLAEDIVTSVIQESQGMFLLAKLHIENLSQKINRKQVRSSLRTLPTTLDATYLNALERIYSQSPDTVELAQSVLFWVVCAKRALTVRELQHIYATQEVDDEVALEDDDLPDSEILMGACGGLIVVDGDHLTARVVHYTAQQYFERCHVQELMTAKMSLTQACLTYLTLPNFSDGVCTSDADMSRRLLDYPFLDYAAKYWGSEVMDLNVEALLEPIVEFASKPVSIDVANQTWSIGTGRHRQWSQEYPRDVPLLVLASAFEMPRILSKLIADGHDVNGRGSDGETPLIRAATYGCNQNVRFLLENGANVDARNYVDQSALFKAARKGDRDVVQTLLRHGADVNMRASSQWTALMSAVSSGSIEVVRLLVEHGADKEALTVWGDSALSIGTRNGLEELATYLADQGAVLPRGPAGRRASLVASRKGLVKLVRRLTADYRPVASLPLQRQGTKLMGGLPQVEEAAEVEPPPETAHSDDEAFLELLEAVGHGVGFLRRYSLAGRIGKGHFAEVFSCSNRATGVTYAVKVFAVRKWEGLRIQDLRQEIDALKNCSHPGIVRFIEVFAEYEEKKVYMVLELMPAGELFHIIVSRQKLTEAESRTVFSQIFSALEYLHGEGWVHRDIKPENILILDADKLIIKLSDFGLCKQLGTGESFTLTSTLCGTPSYVAPEILEESSSRRYGFTADIWSCGVVLYVCLCGFPPFSEELYSAEFPYTLSQQIKSGRFDYPSPYWDPIADPVLDLIDSMIVVDREKRFTVSQCQNHPWVSGTVESVVEDAVRSTSPKMMGQPWPRNGSPSAV